MSDGILASYDHACIASRESSEPRMGFMVIYANTTAIAQNRWSVRQFSAIASFASDVEPVRVK